MSNKPVPSLGSLIGSTRRLILRELSAAFIENQIPLSIEQYIFIYTLNKASNEVTQQNMADLMCKDKSSILRTIDVLEKDGLVKRDADSADRRKNTLHLTSKCKNLLHEVSDIEAKVIERLTAGISGQDYEALVRALGQIQENANK
ncbi:MAG: mgrA 2 [Sphingobacteriaceae bacterium]|jgi:MarR family transcriptional regulator for hemolysin|nr:mgrA 2 [Sphingobacteriaceae bacterium]